MRRGDQQLARAAPAWAEWKGDTHPAWTIGVEEEVMMLNPQDWTLAQSIDYVLRSISPDLKAQVTAETHGSAVELATGVNTDVTAAIGELRELRAKLRQELDPLAIRVACAGTHPSTVWYQTVVSGGERSEAVYGSMRELARREPTFGLHVHIGVPDPEDAIELSNRMRTHIPLLLALSVNSPYWQGRDTGLGSARTPLFQAFPRVGIPLRFSGYEEYVETIDVLIRSDCFPEPTFLWWDVRPQPRFGTVEIRAMDVQSTIGETAALVALVQSVAKLEVEEGFAREGQIARQEVLNENRFLAARDGIEARIVDVETETRIPVRDVLAGLLEAARPHAQELGCDDQLEPLRDGSFITGAARQREIVAGGASLDDLISRLSASFLD